MITQQELHSRMTYDAVTGVATWLTGTKWKGRRVGTRNQSGYTQVRIDGRSYQLHRLIWLWMTGEWPALQVDHRNGIRDDNRWENLRLATHSENQRNKELDARNTSGQTGVCRPAGRTKWQVYINEGGRRKYLGSYATVEEANAVAQSARQAAYGEFAR